MQGLVAGFAMTLLPTCALAVDECAGLKTIDQIYGALSSDKDKVLYERALRCGVRSDDRAARGLAIFHMFSAGGLPDERGDGAQINLSLESNQGDQDAADLLVRMPSFSLWGVRWTEDGHQFAGRASWASWPPAAKGNLVEDQLTVVYQGWPVPDLNNKRDPNATFTTQCTATMSPTKDGTKIEGQLRCQKLPYIFKLSVGI